MAEILISNNQRHPIDLKFLHRRAELILSALGCHDVELSILLTDNREIAHLNKTYRSVDEPTDVLSFPMGNGDPEHEGIPRILGDVVISIEMAMEMSERYNVPLETVLDVLLTHGVLHLLGYDHDTRDNAREMDERALEILRLFGHMPENLNWYLTESWYEDDREG